jgi:hypothetical protein
MNEDNILRNVPNKEHFLNTDTIIHSFTPMLDNLQNIKNDNRTDDSTCTRFVRKKFVCIIIFLLTLMVFMNFFNTITEKLSQDDVQQIYKSMLKYMKKIPQVMSNNITTVN